MAGESVFPEDLDTFPEIDPDDPPDTAGKEHDVVHNNVHAAILATQSKLGIDGSPDPATIDYRVATLEAALGADPNGSLGFGIRGSAITTGLKEVIQLPVSHEVTGWNLNADDDGSLVVELWAGASLPLSSGDKITGTGSPTLSSAANASGNVDDWSAPAIPAGHFVGFYVASVSGLTRANLTCFTIKS
jgi:hypothetical protein